MPSDYKYWPLEGQHTLFILADKSAGKQAIIHTLIKVNSSYDVPAF